MTSFFNYYIMSNKTISMSESDARETYEMLRAAHTLNRMAFGAIAMANSDDKGKAESICKSFDIIFKTIADAAEFYIGMSGIQSDVEKSGN